jgi:hypothetical protein
MLHMRIKTVLVKLVFCPADGIEMHQTAAHKIEQGVTPLPDWLSFSSYMNNCDEREEISGCFINPTHCGKIFEGDMRSVF